MLNKSVTVVVRNYVLLLVMYKIYITMYIFDKDSAVTEHYCAVCFECCDLWDRIPHGTNMYLYDL